MPPDYASYIHGLDVVLIMTFVVKFYSLMAVFLVLNAAFLVAFVWSLLVVARILGIPWVDGTTKGFVDRS